MFYIFPPTVALILGALSNKWLARSLQQISPTIFFTQIILQHYNPYWDLLANVKKHGCHLRQDCSQLGKFSQCGGGELLLSESIAGVLAFVKDSLEIWKKSINCKPSWGTVSKGM